MPWKSGGKVFFLKTSHGDYKDTEGIFVLISHSGISGHSGTEGRIRYCHISFLSSSVPLCSSVIAV
jgi:hypothetical protein